MYTRNYEFEPFPKGGYNEKQISTETETETQSHKDIEADAFEKALESIRELARELAQDQDSGNRRNLLC